MPSPLLDPAELVGFDGVILDCRSGAVGPERLVGSVRADLEGDLSAVGDPARGGRHPLPSVADFASTLGRWGIGPDTSVAVIDRACGGNYASRAWWMLRAVGHDAVQVVDGGWEAAVAAGVEVVEGEAARAEREPYPVAGWKWPRVGVSEVDLRRQDRAWKVVDARSEARWRGEEEPIDPVPGRIEGSVNLPWERTVGSNGRLRSPEELRALLDEVLGDVPADRVIAQCGSGVTACQLILASELAGRGVPALYVGSYGEWCRR